MNYLKIKVQNTNIIVNGSLISAINMVLFQILIIIQTLQFFSNLPTKTETSAVIEFNLNTNHATFHNELSQ